MTTDDDRYDVVVVGGGPAGLSAALNLVRARRRTLVVDGNRPRNAVTLHTHGFLTRDGITPIELRSMGRHEVRAYPDGETNSGEVESVEAIGAVEAGGATHNPADAAPGFRVRIRGVRGGRDRVVTARAVLAACGVREELPEIPGMRYFYGLQLHSCLACDGYEKRDRPLVLIGETDDLAEQALAITRWSDDVLILTGGVGRVAEDEERMLAPRGIRVDRRPIAELVGERDRLVGIRMRDGELIRRDCGFVRPHYRPRLKFLAGLGVETDAGGLLLVDPGGATSRPGVYGAGDTTAAGPRQLIIAAGEGAAAARRISLDLG